MPSDPNNISLDLLSEIMASPRADVDYTELALCFLNEAGGTESFVQKVWATYEDAPEGGMIKHQILKSILDVFGKAAQLNKGQARDETQMTEEELLHDLLPAMQQLTEKKGLTVNDLVAATAAASSPQDAAANNGSGDPA